MSEVSTFQDLVTMLASPAADKLRIGGQTFAEFVQDAERRFKMGQTLRLVPYGSGERWCWS